MRTCDGVTKRVYPGGVFRNKPTVVEELADQGICVPQDDRFFPYRACFDFEAYQEPIDQVNTGKTEWMTTHVPLSVSIHSNIPGYDTPVCYVSNGDPHALIADMMAYLNRLSDQSFDILAQRYESVLATLDERIPVVTPNQPKPKRTPYFQRLKDKFLAYLAQLPVLGLNSGNYDFNLIKQQLYPYLAQSNSLKFIIKRNNNHMALATAQLKFLDIRNYLAPNYSYDKWVKAYDCQVTKGIFCYSYIDSLARLEETSLPSREAFYNDLKDKACSVEDYEHLCDVWQRQGMTTLRDFLVWYNNLDVIPFMEAAGKMVTFYKTMGVDVFKDCISIPGLTMRYLFNDLPAVFSLISDEDQDMHTCLKKNIVGGPSIIFHRYHEKGVTRIRGGKLCQGIVGFDANALYLACLGSPMPSGHYTRWRPVTDKPGVFISKSSAKIGLADQWLEWQAEVLGIPIRHRLNATEKRIGDRQLPVDGFGVLDGEPTVFQILAWQWAGSSLTERMDLLTDSGENRDIHVDVYSDSVFKYLESGDGVDINLKAIRGANIADLTKVVANKSQPDIVLVHVGTNNLTSCRASREITRRHFVTLLDKLAYIYSCPVVVSSILPRRDRQDLDTLRRHVNILLGNLAVARGFSFYSWEESFGVEKVENFSIDGLHPSRAGNCFLHRQIRAFMHWYVSGDRKTSQQKLSAMICEELWRGREMARQLRKAKLQRKTKHLQQQHQCRQITFPCKARKRKHLQRRPSQYKRRTAAPPPTAPLQSSLLEVAGQYMVRPGLTGWRTYKAHCKPTSCGGGKAAIPLPAHTPKKLLELSIGCPFCPLNLTCEDDLLDHFLQKHRPAEGPAEGVAECVAEGVAECVAESVAESVEEMIPSSSSSTPVTVRQVGMVGGAGPESREDYFTLMKSNQGNFIVTPRQKLIGFHVGPNEDTTHFGTSTSRLPPVRQLEEIKMQLIKLENQDHKEHHVELESGLKFSLKDINNVIHLHTLKRIGRQVEEERAWFSCNNFPTINAETPLSSAKIKEYASLIWSNPPDDMLSINNDNLCVDDLVTVTCTKWLSNFLLCHLADKISKQCPSVHFIYVLPTALDSLPVTICRSLERLKNSETTQNPNQIIIFYFLVSLSPSCSKSSIEAAGDHFVFASYFVKDNLFVYADPLGYDVPEMFFNKFKSGLLLSGTDPELLELTKCHPPNFKKNSNSHECVQGRCSQVYPLQTCGSICGVAAVIGFAICAFKPDLFKFMLSTQSIESQITQIKYLKDISKYSTFLRFVIINWILSPEIDISLVLNKCPQSKMGKPTYLPVVVDCKKLNSTGTEMTEERQDRQTELLAPKSTSTFKPTQTASKKRQYKLEYPDTLNSMLKSAPLVSYWQKERKLCLTVHPNGSKKSIVKKVPCNELGIKDLSAISKLNAFLNSESCANRVAEFSQPITQSSADDEWEEVAQIQTGIEMKNYCENFTFDTCKKFCLNSCIRPSYQSNNMTLKVSVTSHPTWGKSHRLDETYTFVSKRPEQDIPVVKLYIKCSSKSDQCRADCGSLLSSINIAQENCSGCGENLNSDLVKLCENCNVTESPQWYNCNGQCLCNPCYRYNRKYGKHRPKSLQDKSKQHHGIQNKHLNCKWELKCYIYASKVNIWKIYARKTNKDFHQCQPYQQKKKPSLLNRDAIDNMRATQKASANQIIMTFQRQQSIHIGDNLQTRKQRELTTKTQVENRIKSIDKHIKQEFIQKADEFPLPGSDWRNAEKVLEQHLNSVLFFQRGIKDKKRNYHAVLANSENLNLTRKFGMHILGYDNKYDLTSYRFPVGLVTLCDQFNKGRGVAVSICNSEESSSHSLTLKMVLLNVPCGEASCNHNEEIHVFDDGNGFFKYKPCSLTDLLRPTVQHDKDASIKSAVAEIGLKSSLCNFHALQAFRKHVNSDSSLKLFIRPLETGFKSIMRSWIPEVRKSLIETYIQFIYNDIPNNLVKTETKADFIKYLQNNWFFSLWHSSFTAEILYAMPVLERRNPLILTDNVTERKFRDIDESIFNSQINKSITCFFINMINIFLYKDGNDLTVSGDDSPPREVTIHHGMEKELNTAERGIKIAFDGRVNTDDFLQEHGWFGIKFQDKTVSQVQDTGFPDDHFTSSETNSLDVDIDHDYSYMTSQSQTSDILELSKQLTDEHSYDVLSKCKKLLSKQEFNIAKNWHNKLLSCIPLDVKNKLHTEHCQYVCNIKIGICSCYSFICRGQPYFCKHLYSGLATMKNIFNARQLVKSYCQHNPTFDPQQSSECSILTKTPSQTLTVLQKTLNELRSNTHPATEHELGGFMLTLLHDKPLRLTQFSGRLANRQPHNLGLRRSTGPITDSRYSLVNPALQDKESELDEDPYRPKIDFPAKGRERHGGRKRNRTSNRGTNFAKMVTDALEVLGQKMTCDNLTHSYKDVSTCEPPASVTPPQSPCPSPPPCLQTPPPPEPAQKPEQKPHTQSNQTAVGPTCDFTKELIMCKFCMLENINKLFICSSVTEYHTHLINTHGKNGMLCYKCYKSNGTIMEFSSALQLRLHDKQIHRNINICRKLSLKRKLTDIKESRSEELLTSYASTKGNPGLSNYAKHNLVNFKKSKLSLKKNIRKSISGLEYLSKKKLDKKQWTCPKCSQLCTSDPPSIGCDKCDIWYHFRCINMQEAPPDTCHWYCSPCKRLK